MIETGKTKIVKHGQTVAASEPALDPIDALAEEFLSRLRDGESPKIEDYAAKHPDLAEEIRELFPTLAMLDKFGAEEPNPHTASALASFQEVPPRLGEYQIRGEIGRGGMGIVYDAIHRTIERRVALKVLPRDKVAQGKNLKRFLRETRAAGNLHHTNIVPVFEVGFDQGVYYYSMQYIHGQNLDAVIEELRRHQQGRNLAEESTPTQIHGSDAGPSSDNKTVADHLLSGKWERPGEGTTNLVEGDLGSVEPITVELPGQDSVARPGGSRVVDVPRSSEFESVGEASDSYFRRAARVGLQVAEALAYAHQQGVLHRDIKPSNLLLDLQGVVWVTDFGLAKQEGEDFTHTGDIVGTLRYMAPERFRGQADARSDLYSLGLTLYELATFRYAFEQNDRAELIHHVTHETPPAPRTVNPRIPRDLETIILKSIDKDPFRRYQSAEDLVEDLRLFVHDHPIKARRASLSERTWRWCRRNPSQALLIASVALLLLVLAGGSLYSAHVSARHADELRSETHRAQDAEQSAHEATRVATKALYESHFGQAQAGRWSQRPGQHFASLAALSEAAKILPTLDLERAEFQAEKLKLRNAAVAAMPLIDVRARKTWLVEPGWTGMVAFTRDYDAYAHSDIRGNISIRRALDDEELQFLTGPGMRAWLLAFSPDGRYLAGKFHDQASPPVLWVWDLEVGRIILECDEKSMVVDTMSFSPDGTKLAVASRDQGLRIYSLPDAECILEKSFDPPVSDLCFDPNGTRIALATNKGAQLLDLTPMAMEKIGESNAGDEGLIFFEPAGPLASIAWNGDYLSGGTPSGLIRVWEAQHPEAPLHELEGHLARVTQLNASHSGELLLSRSWDGTSRLWDLTRGREALRMDVENFTRSGFSSDDRWIGFSGTALTFGIWEVSSGGPLRSIGRKAGDNGRWMTQYHPVFSDLVATATNRGAQIWNLRTGKQLGVVPSGHTKAVLFSTDGASLFTSGDLGLCQWPIDVGDDLESIQTGPQKQLLSGPTGRASMDDAGRRVAAVRGNRHAIVIDLEEPTLHTILSPHADLDRAVISPNGQLVVTATWQGKGVRVWDRETGLLKNLTPEVGSATPAFSPDGRWLAIATGETHFLFDTATWQCRHRIVRDRPDGWPGEVAFSPDSRRVAFTYTRYSTQLLDVATGDRIAILEPPDRRTVGWSTFSSRGKRLIITEDDFFQIWNLESLFDQVKAMSLD